MSTPHHLSQIVTEWSLLRQAHAGQASEARPAQELLLERYGGGIRRYLMGCLKNADAAEEVFQEFALRFLKGGLQGADPNRGRFRNFLKGVLFNLIGDYWQRRQRLPTQIESTLDPADSGAGPEADAAFLASWRDELLALAWRDLQRLELTQGQPFYTLLSHRRDHPEERSEAMAAALSEKLKRPMTAAGVRQALHRAREKFADLLLEQVAHSLAEPDLEELTDELAQLQLLQYCQPALDRLRAEQAEGNA